MEGFVSDRRMDTAAVLIHPAIRPLPHQSAPFAPVVQPFPLRPVPVSRETFPSFISRFSAMNGVSGRDFCRDRDFSLKRAVELERDVVERIGAFGGLSSDALATMLSWTGERAGDVRMTFRGEIFGSRALRNPKVRGCPVCLRDDAVAHRGAAVEAMAMRGDWQFREVSLCLRHRHPLVLLWEVDSHTERHDIGSRLAEIEDRVLGGDFDRPLSNPDAYDLWLDRRLGDGSDPTWLSEHSLHAATIFIRLLGAELLRLNPFPPEDQDLLRAAQATGFEVVRGGEEAIIDALDALARHSGGHNDEPLKAFGQLYANLSRLYLDEAGFAPFRRLLRDRILRHWPVAAGETVLGEALPQRRLHSVVTAAREAGVTADLMRSFLLEAGAFEPDDPRPDSRRTFEAEQFAPLIAEIPTLVGPGPMRAAMRATKKEFEALAADGVLVPRTRVPKIKAPWRLADGVALVVELQAVARPVAADDAAWESILRARQRRGIPVGTLIAAIRAGRLQAGQRESVEGYSGIVVARTEVDRLAEEEAHRAVPDLPSAAAFGRSVGLRDGGRFLALVAAGHTPVTKVQHPRLGYEMFVVSEADVAAFHRRFVTTTTLSTEWGEHRNTIIVQLEAAGVARFAPEGTDFGAIYLRRDVEAAVGRQGRAALSRTS